MQESGYRRLRELLSRIPRYANMTLEEAEEMYDGEFDAELEPIRYLVKTKGMSWEEAGREVILGFLEDQERLVKAEGISYEEARERLVRQFSRG